MSIPPVPSTSFSFYPDINLKEEQEALPNVKNKEKTKNRFYSLKDRVYLMIDSIGYNTYSTWIDLPPVMPIEFAEAKYNRTIREVSAFIPKPFEEIRQKVLAYPEWAYTRSWGHKLERENLELYSSPEIRKAKAKEYLERGQPKTKEENEEEWLVLTFCKQELHDLYRAEPKYLDTRHIDVLTINGSNRTVLTKHRKEWNKLTLSEKAEKIFGKRNKYEIVAIAAASVSCFFLCQSIYQQRSCSQ